MLHHRSVGSINAPTSAARPDALKLLGKRHGGSNLNTSAAGMYARGTYPMALGGPSVLCAQCDVRVAMGRDTQLISAARTQSNSS